MNGIQEVGGSIPPGSTRNPRLKAGFREIGAGLSNSAATMMQPTGGAAFASCGRTNTTAPLRAIPFAQGRRGTGTSWPGKRRVTVAPQARPLAAAGGVAPCGGGRPARRDNGISLRAAKGLAEKPLRAAGLRIFMEISMVSARWGGQDGAAAFRGYRGEGVPGGQGNDEPPSAVPPGPPMACHLAPRRQLGADPQRGERRHRLGQAAPLGGAPPA